MWEEQDQSHMHKITWWDSLWMLYRWTVCKVYPQETRDTLCETARSFICRVSLFCGDFQFALPSRALQVRPGLSEMRQQARPCPCRCHSTFNSKRWQPMWPSTLWTMSQGSVLCCTHLFCLPGFQPWKSDQRMAPSPSGLVPISFFLLLFSYVQFIMYAFIIHIFNKATLMGFFIVVYRPAVSSHSLCISVIARNDTGQQLWLFLRQEIVSGELTYLRQTVYAALRFAAQTGLPKFLAPLRKPTGLHVAHGSSQVCWGLVGCARYSLGHSRLDTARDLR